MEQEEIVKPYSLTYSDLISLSSSSPSLDSIEFERLRSVSRSVIETLGPTGPGLLAITDVPRNVSALRESLLPLARDLALLDHEHRKRVLKDHDLGSDVPLKNLDRRVSSFAMQLNYQHHQNSNTQNGRCQNTTEESIEVDGSSSVSVDSKFKNLGSNFRELGHCMMDIGLCLARVCDRAIGGNELEHSLLDSGSAKGRLIHYHSDVDALVMKESARKKRSRKNYGSSNFRPAGNTLEGCTVSSEITTKGGSEDGSRIAQCDLWQQWHYDYGTLTVLTSPMFTSPSRGETADTRDQCVSSCTEQCPSPCEHSCLQIYHPNKNKICIIKALPESFIIQVGESADILSRGKLHSTLHSVCRPRGLEMFSRETFVVFLQPAWNKVFDISDFPMESLSSYDYSSEVSGEEPQDGQPDLKKAALEFHKVVPPLLSRLRNGMTFAEFSRETTKQYYGGKGLQSNRSV